MNIDFNALPQNVQRDIRDTLKAYDVVHVTFANGEYHVLTATALLAEYPADYKVIGDVSKDDVYTKEEQIINYVECFHDYPADYKGKRNYKMLQYMKDHQKNGKECKVEIIDGEVRLLKRKVERKEAE